MNFSLLKNKEIDSIFYIESEYKKRYDLTKQSIC